MNPRHPVPLLLLAALAALLLPGCERSTEGLIPAPGNTDPLVFDDTFGAGVDFQAFLGSKVDAVAIDPNEWFVGTASLRVTVPAPGDPSGTYAGGAFTGRTPRELSGYNALSFWAKASMAVTLDVAGLGNDNTGTSKYEASWTGIPLTTTWSRFVIPIPQSDRLNAERGLFFMAEGPEQGLGFQMWFDEIRFETLATISDPRPSMPTRTLDAFIGGRVNVEGTQTVFAVDGVDRTIKHQSGYFDFVSSNDTVAVVTGERIEVVGSGTAILTASLGGLPVLGQVTVRSIASPTTPAPVPTLPAQDVISLFSNAYSDVTVDTWLTTWSQPQGGVSVTDFKIAGDDVKAYTKLGFAGIEFVSETVDATAMTHFHMDLWVPPGTTLFRVKLVDFGANGVFGGGDDREDELAFNTSSTPPLVGGAWIALDLPLSDFTGLTTRAHLAQLIIASQENAAFVDNVYFHR